MYEHLRNQKAHSYTGFRQVCCGRTSTPLSSSSSGTPPVKKLACPVLIEVSVGVASEKSEREGACVEALDWWTQAGAIEDVLRTERESEHGGIEAEDGPRPSESEERRARRAEMSSSDDCSHSPSGFRVIESSRTPSRDSTLAGHSGCRSTAGVAQASVSLRLMYFSEVQCSRVAGSHRRRIRAEILTVGYRRVFARRPATGGCHGQGET